MRDQGACLSPFNSFLLLQGLETLSLRVERHVENAGKVVDFLQKQPKVAAVHHPSLAQGREKELYERYYPKGGASIFTFEIKGSEEQARTFTESPVRILAACKCGGREIPCNSSGLHNPFTDECTGAGSC